jgi:hypothetical protein
LVRRRGWSLGDADDGAEFVDCVSGFVQGGLLFGRELDLDDLFDALGAELARNADEETADAVLALQVRSAREDLLLILEDGFDHLDGGG